jgi:dihydroorotate dehydrogenase
MLARASLLARGRLVLIGTGGISTGRDVLTKIQAGASLVQLYTAFVYHGPGLIPRLKTELLAALRDERIASLQDAVGTRAQELAEQL